MEQHPVPQHISSFEFKLFGNLTIRQFVTMAIPMSIAGIIYFSTIPPIIRLPLSLLIALFGIFISLVPLGGRPFHQWVIAFVKSILSPTQRVWVKEAKIPEYLSIIIAVPKVTQKPPEPISEYGRERLVAYVRSLPKKQISPLDVKEQMALGNLQLPAFEQTKEGKLPLPIIWPALPSLQEYPAAYRASLPQVEASIPVQETAESVNVEIKNSSPSVQVQINNHARPYVLGGIEQRLKGDMPKTNLASSINFTTETVIPIRTHGRQIKFVHGIGKVKVRKLHFAPPRGFDLSKLPIRGERRFEISQELKKRFHLSDDVLYQAPQVILPVDEAKNRSTVGRSSKSPKAEISQTVWKQPTPLSKPSAEIKVSPSAHLAPQKK